MQIETFERTLDEQTALERTRNLSFGQYCRHWIADRLDRYSVDTDYSVSLVYYPDYIAYTSVTIRKTLGTTKSLRFLAGIDAVTGDVGEIDVELPPYRTNEIDPSRIVSSRIEDSEASDLWREWLFSYVSRYYRATAMPEYSLDELQLVYTPYWLIDKGTVGESLVVSDLTRRTSKVEEIEVIKEFYRIHAGTAH
ncbi:MAG: hypothetical protein IH933_14990 [Euryarchaeota archaeon]|jgi:hypothetical protein|nr:hypothetical protein [Euryarchaeota archaeon]